MGLTGQWAVFTKLSPTCWAQYFDLPNGLKKGLGLSIHLKRICPLACLHKSYTIFITLGHNANKQPDWIFPQ